MFKKILNLFLRDIISISRDKTLIVMVVVPVLFTVIIRFFVSPVVVETSSISFAVDSRVEQEFVDKLEDYGNVARYDSPEKVKDRVNGIDDIIGITKDSGQYTVILEGNEKAEMKEIAAIVMDGVLREEALAEFEHQVVGSSRFLFREYFGIMLVLMIIFMQGMLVSFYIIEEKESKVISAIAVSPMRLWQYLLARWILVLITVTFLSMIAGLMLEGTSISYTKLFIGAVFSSSLAVVVGFIVGGLVNKQIEGMVVREVISLGIFTIPIAAIFVHDQYQYFLYPFPSYWVFRILKNIFIDAGSTGDFWMSCGITLASSVIILIILLPFLKRRIQIK